MSEFEHLLVEIQPPLARITVNRPNRLNALNRATLQELQRALEQVEAETAVRAVILTGAGDRAFVAGADIRELAELDARAAREYSRLGQALLRRLELLSIPVIAAINGFALGGGLELAMACTLRIAAEQAKLGLPEVKLGLLPGFGGTQRLPRLIPAGVALEMMLTGEPVTAAEALQHGLVSRVVPAAELSAAAEQLAQRIAANAPLAIGFCLEAVRRGAEMGLDAALGLESNLFALACTTQDMKEGTRAFLEKRSPQFQGQ